MGAHANYNASIELSLTVPIGYDYSVLLLERQVALADAAHPWVSHYLGGEQASSIHWQSAVGMKEGNGIDRIYTIEVRPHFLMTRDQLFAYERYGDTLAKYLASVVDEAVLRVQSRLIVNGVFSEGYKPKFMSQILAL